MKHDASARSLVRELQRAGLETLDDSATRAQYSSDASLYRVPPLAVVRPKDTADVVAAVKTCHDLGVPFTARGAGTSVAGNAIGPGVVADFSRHMNSILDIDTASGQARVQPGVVHAQLQRTALLHGWRFGPDPSTHSRCTIGGMIGNNACGSRSLGYGRTSDNVSSVNVVVADGDQIRAGYDSSGIPCVQGGDHVLARLREAMAKRLAVARTEFDRFGRQVSGYAVQHLLPERFDLCKALVGSEGTLAVVTEATVQLVHEPAHRVLVVLGYDDIVAAAGAVPDVLAFRPAACEGLDSRLVDTVRRRRGGSRIPALPDGRAWLFVEIAGDHFDEVSERASALTAAHLGDDARAVSDESEAAVLWRIREDGAGLAGVAPSGKPAWAGWEDAAVPPAALADYLRDFDALVAAADLTMAPYGHFGEGCVHVRLDFPFDRHDGTEVFRAFLDAAATLVAGYGGTLSGEHGDGRARSQLLPTMYSAEAIGLFRDVKAAFDPNGVLNPGVVVDPEPVDAAVRVTHLPIVAASSGFRFDGDRGDLGTAVHRCTGVGKCRADNSANGGLMCPSYLATAEEKDSTRGRARVLQEALRGQRPELDSLAVHEALDLCLSCKGCTSDCPTGIDMPTLKSEVLQRIYRRRLRPRTHYSLGMLPRWIRLAAPVAPLVNRVLSRPRIAHWALRAAGIDPRRSMVSFPRESFQSRWRERASGDGPPVMLFTDTFSAGLSPDTAMAAADLLVSLGYSVQFPPRSLCCGLTWITTGQLTAAKRMLTRTVDTLFRATEVGIPIVGVEPSCTAVLRHDARELLGGDRAAAVAANTFTLAEFLTTQANWTPPDLSGVKIIAQPHCHHRAIMTWDTDRSLLLAAGADVTEVAGCCGLAGNFGMEAGHYDVSIAVARQHLLPSLDEDPDAIVLADGFSCRTQIADLRHRRAMHLAEILRPSERPPAPRINP